MALTEEQKEIALRVAKDMVNLQPLEKRYGVDAEFTIEFVTRFLAMSVAPEKFK